MKALCTFIFALLIVSQVKSQDKFLTKTGYIFFFSHSLVEDIKAENNQGLSIIDTKTGEIAIQVLMRSFKFEKALMQEHFNENYMESDTYPKAIFKGAILNFDKLPTQQTTVNIVGKLTVHGKEKKIKTKAILQSTSNEIILRGSFMVEVADFDIKIPSIVINNIAKIIKISFEFHHTPYK
ncbi:MAG: YceI family protein [Lutibacter sp.]|uniref:YceI family protein n=1 Tax=Lutibacter sp. TaxID=1925666 RepID=UPI00385FEC56